jgi:hypothetical protein
MSSGHELNYEALIDRSIKDFQPVKRLWPVGTRLALWSLLITGILALSTAIGGGNDPATLVHPAGHLLQAGLFLFASIGAAFLALRSAIPGREVTRPELLILLTVVCVAFAGNFEPASSIPLTGVRHAGLTATLELFGLATLPWLSLFWAVRRAVPMEPAKTGAVVGIAGFCFAFAVQHLISQPSVPNPLVWQILFGLLVTGVSALAGAVWLNWIERWQERDASQTRTSGWTAFGAPVMFPVAMAASLVALIFILRTTRASFAPVPDFDLAIDNYQRALSGFRPNVPSGSIETVLTAYVEHGMPAYMWDFDAEGFKLVGGRWQPLADGTPVTYTWFRGSNGGVMCLFRQTDGFNPPSTGHEELHHLLFYRYRGFSVCLINVGGYGNFISVIAAPMPLKQFERLVLAAML